MRHMDFSTLRDLLTRKHAVITRVRNDGGFGKVVNVLVDGKHEYEAHLSGAQVLALDIK